MARSARHWWVPCPCYRFWVQLGQGNCAFLIVGVSHDGGVPTGEVRPASHRV